MADFSGGPGFLAFVATFALVVGSILLFRSLSKHLRKVRTHPPEGEKAPRADSSAGDQGVVESVSHDESGASTPDDEPDGTGDRG